RRYWIQLERRRRDDGKAAERSGHQPAEVVTCDVLDDDAAGLRGRSIDANDVDPDDQIARCPVPVTPRTGVIRGDDAADGRAIGRWRIERNPLTVARQLAVDGGERRARLHRRPQIAVPMRNTGVAPSRRDADVSGRRRSPTDFRAAA